ncbi:NAD-dependent epimerase/dehydratase family protein [Planctomycetota bacterium]|nr:NAD-dependent epimerase/dehydratase family protein [Planctomycetota bacterium]
MSVVAITGIAGGLGSQLLMQFDVDDDIETVVGFDVTAEPRLHSPKLEYLQRKATDALEDAFVEHNVDIAIHLAFADDGDADEISAINLVGARKFLAACHAAEVGTVCVLSSAMSYGATADNPDFFYEGAALNPPTDLPLAALKAQVEDLCYDFIKEHPNVALQIVRPCLMVGAHVKNALTDLLAKNVVLAPLGYDPPIQLIHEDDVIRAICRLVKLQKVGVFNLAADGALTLDRMARLAERRVVRLPLWLLNVLGWFGLASMPRAVLPYFVYPWVIACIKLRTEGMMMRFDAAQAFLDYLEARDEPASVFEDELDEFDSDEEVFDDETEPVDEPGVIPDPFASDPFAAESAPETDSVAAEPEPDTVAAEREPDPDKDSPAASEPAADPQPAVAPEPESQSGAEV